LIIILGYRFPATFPFVDAGNEVGCARLEGKVTDFDK